MAKHDGRIGFKGKVIKSPAKAIRAFCKECVETSKDIEECTGWYCPIFPFRFGKNPYYGENKNTQTEEFSDEE